MSKWQVLVFLTLLLTGLAVAAPVPHALTYSNGQDLKRGALLFYHDGSPLLDASGHLYYPSWQGGRLLRSVNYWPLSALTVWQPSGLALMERHNVLWYPSHDQVSPLLSDGKVFYHRSGHKLAERDSREVFHDSGVVAWDGKDRIWNSGGQEIDDGHVLVSSNLQPLDGAMSINLHKTNGLVAFHFVLWIDLIQAGYVSPFVYQSENQIPEKLFSDLVFHVETGYPGELLTVRVSENSKVSFAFQDSLMPTAVSSAWPMYPFMGLNHSGLAEVGITSGVNTVPCAAQILLNHPSHNTAYPPGFTLKTHPRTRQ